MGCWYCDIGTTTIALGISRGFGGEAAGVSDDEDGGFGVEHWKGTESRENGGNGGREETGEVGG